MDNEKTEKYKIQIDGSPDLQFTGELIAEVKSSSNNASGSYSGAVGRWTELALYKTAGGKYICHSIGRTQWQGEHDRYSGKICETVDEVIKFFGHGWLAKDLYTLADIDAAVTVD